MSTTELLQAWRDAIRAAELAERLAAVAAQASEIADIRSVEADEIATLAEQAAAVAMAAAERARAFATHVSSNAEGLRGDAAASRDTAETMHRIQGEAKGAYHDAEQQARDVHAPPIQDGQTQRVV